ncbi:unnamed protein product, partial [Owenia fusiformis]
GGSRSRTCQYNGEWTGTETVCEKSDRVKQCDDIKVDNGKTEGNGRRRGDLRVYSCKNGYTLSGSEERTCLSNGEWSGTEPECTPDIGGVAAQKVCSPFECPDGWSLVPDSTETTTRCVSGEQVTCISMVTTTMNHL